MTIEIDGMTPLIQVFDMARSLAFYRDLLGFKVLTDSGDGDRSSWVWLRLNGADLMLNDQYEPGHEPDEPPPERSRWHDDTCLYFGCSDPDAVFDHLRSKQIDCKPPIETGYGMKQLYVSDPDNYNLCFQCPITEKNDG
ncbi:MAG: VOC family protein [Pyrinomonadaceae bacterium]